MIGEETSEGRLVIHEETMDEIENKIPNYRKLEKTIKTGSRKNHLTATNVKNILRVSC
jgi:hypothetical protein